MNVPNYFRNKNGYFFRINNVSIGQVRYKRPYEYFLQVKMTDGWVLNLHKGPNKPPFRNLIILNLIFYPPFILIIIIRHTALVPAIFFGVLSILLEMLRDIILFDFSGFKKKGDYRIWAVAVYRAFVNLFKKD